MSPHTSTRTGREAGLTLVELMVAVTILIVGVLSFAQTFVNLERAEVRNREAARATQAARSLLERMQAEAFPEVFRRFNEPTGDDPGGAATAPGAGFAVPGLTAIDGDADGLPGEVIFPIDPASPGTLRENVTSLELGMPRDLNGDGDTNDAGLVSNYRILPVVVRVRWRGAAGPGSVELRTILGNY